VPHTPVPSPRIIPAIEQLRRDPLVGRLEAQYGREAVVEALRAEAAALRGKLAAARGPGASGPSEDHPERLPVTEADAARVVLAGAARHLTQTFTSTLQRVVNATGVIVHTNLGRAPLADAAIQRIADLAGRYSTLEFDLGAGARGRRDIHAEALLTRLTGAEAAVVVNNNAAATMLMLAALARGREVIISRGELVEIGGGFRVPDVMAQSGAVLREVGTTNRTRAADYAAAITDRTGLILRVHPSNFRIHGFTERPDLTALAALAHTHGVALAEDLGSGLLAAPGRDAPSLAEEPDVRSSLEAGVDVLCFSGDKLLGGPQAGILVGRRALLTTIRRHPLMRALRVDKLTYAALEGTLLAWSSGRAAGDVPVARMIALSRESIGERAERMAARLRSMPGIEASVIDGCSTIGGGSAPGSEIPTRLIAVGKQQWSTDRLSGALRAATPPVIGRIEEDRLLLDLRTVREDEDDEIVAAIGALDP
jgi:L-seryl-tRNA(Ser) seleniumtransferase